MLVLLLKIIGVFISLILSAIIVNKMNISNFWMIPLFLIVASLFGVVGFVMKSVIGFTVLFVVGVIGFVILKKLV